MSKIANKVIFTTLFLTFLASFARIEAVENSILEEHSIIKSESLANSGKKDGEDKVGKVWAILVAGSNGWWNYRHQADICHAYHILRNHGIPEENIVTMMYDDIAHNDVNPYKGQIFNHPKGKDVYAGVKIDYTGASVTPENFMAILRGDVASVVGGNKRVINSTKDDNVFVYFSDHGGYGMLGFPSDVLTVKTLHDNLVWMRKNERHKKLTFYLEACESGSMFQYQLFKSFNIYAITASNASESSWGIYCYNDLVDTCLGDEFSVSWMEHSDRTDLRHLTLEAQFEAVKNLTKGSHVMRFGNRDIGTDFVSEFQGNQPYKEDQVKDEDSALKMKPGTRISTFEIPLAMLKMKHEKTVVRLEKMSYQKQMQDILEKRKTLEAKLSSIVESLVDDPSARAKIMTIIPEHIGRVQCHHDVVHAFNRHCFKMTEYVLKFGYVFANLCEHGLVTEQIVNTIVEQCKSGKFQGTVW